MIDGICLDMCGATCSLQPRRQAPCLANPQTRASNRLYDRLTVSSIYGANWFVLIHFWFIGTDVGAVTSATASATERDYAS